eukprot:scaffold46190_cov29-Tisochrysis_lutea.AAC.4
MVSDSLRKALTKQGYKVVGSHSGVKLCRWTKAMLRGRGGCYKHTFYGIASYSCMEATPSLACANKCVFCWRHHDNPVGTSFRWQIDDPIELVRSCWSEITLGHSSEKMGPTNAPSRARCAGFALPLTHRSMLLVDLMRRQGGACRA